MDDTITIPRKVAMKGDLILMPRTKYEELLRISKRYIKLDHDVEVSFTELKQGKAIGPFDSAKELLKSLSKKDKK